MKFLVLSMSEKGGKQAKELWKVDNPPKWAKELERYVNYLRAKGAKPNFIATVKSYVGHLGQRFDKPYLDISREELETWFAELREGGVTGQKGLADASLHSTVGRVRTCLRFLNHGLTPDSIRGLSYGKTRKRIRGNDELLTQDEIKVIGNSLKQPWKTIFLTLAHTGARPTEVLSLKVGDVEGPQTQDGTAFFIIYFRETKTGQPRQATVFDQQAIQVLEEFMQVLAPESGNLFPARSGELRDHATYRMALKRVQKRLGWSKNIFPYLTRHSYVTKLRELGFGDSDIMEQCGFEDARMLQNYGTPKPDALRRRMAKKLAPEPMKKAPTQSEIDRLVEKRVAAALKDLRPTDIKGWEKAMKEHAEGLVAAMQARDSDHS